MTLYDDHFQVLNTPVSNYPGRLTTLAYLTDATGAGGDGRGSFIAFGGNSSRDPTSGASCAGGSCLAVYFVYADFSTPAGFSFNGSSSSTSGGGVYAPQVSLLCHACTQASGTTLPPLTWLRCRVSMSNVMQAAVA